MPQNSDNIGYGSLNAAGATAVVPVAGKQAVGISLPAGLVGTVTPQFSYDNGVTFWTDLTTPPIILPLAGTSVSGSLPVPAGATHAQLRVSAYTSGSSVATLSATTSAGPMRVSASGPLAAATATVVTTGNPQSATGNFVAIPVDPTKWASVVISTSAAAFNGTLTWDVMIDGRWVTFYTAISAGQPLAGCPLAVLTSAGTGNPTVAGSVVYTTTAADTWELPLPGNATQARVRCSAFTSGTVTVTIAPGRPCVPGVPVCATMADTSDPGGTSGTGFAGNMEIGGWRTVTGIMMSPTGQVFNARPIDDAGATMASATILGTAGATSTITFARTGALGSVSNVVGSGQWAAMVTAARRLAFTLASGGSASTGRLIVTATR